jgi:L-seryl-tRNA(Ser) seleniumtransferase
MGPLQAAVGDTFVVAKAECASQIGSGALPLETLPSIGISVAPKDKKGAGSRIESLAAAFRGLAIPVIGRIEKGALTFDLRCLDDEAAFVRGLTRLVA